MAWVFVSLLTIQFRLLSLKPLKCKFFLSVYWWNIGFNCKIMMAAIWSTLRWTFTLWEAEAAGFFPNWWWHELGEICWIIAIRKSTNCAIIWKVLCNFFFHFLSISRLEWQTLALLIGICYGRRPPTIIASYILFTSWIGDDYHNFVRFFWCTRLICSH